jgi:glycine/sarcosine/betaine reductase complex component C subunit beta
MPVIKGVAYSLFHSPDILFHNGSTQVTERAKNAASEYLAKLPDHLRGFDAALAYAPNQAYIGNIALDELRGLPRPWYDNPAARRVRFGPYGEIMPEEEFYGLMKIADSFDLVLLESEFLAEVRARL